MSNIIQLTVPTRIAPLEARITALLGAFADHRRHGDDVFWLKENAELLNILECTGQAVAPEALARHAAFYAQAVQRLEFFPQYYRFILSLALDLEDLGMPGDQAQKMVDFAAREGLAEAELSDLQRAESRRLMTRRGVDPVRDAGLNDRLREFCSRTKTFALPNKKAAYELTHIVYYLSEYGRRDPGLPSEAIQSLHFAGLTAFLDQNADLLAEICIALRYCGEVPPGVWTAWLEGETAAYGVIADVSASVNDDYHEYLVCNWHQAVTGAPLFRKALRDDRLRFERGARAQTVLRELSQAIYGLDHRSGDWDRMRPRMEPALSPEARDVLSIASQSSALFDAYFEGFARAGRA
ncbi:hypothetical protein KUV73_12205 [Mameliella alba]|nr:hypothetical protein [Mameliella alba]MBY6169891.1 hypothetical protein [Mameliella alba]MBY6175132.1 hypothetical protein [Mameliella alba]